MREIAYAECETIQGGWVWSWLWQSIAEQMVEMVLTNAPAVSSNTSNWGVVGPGSFDNFNASSINAVNGHDSMSDSFTGVVGGFFGDSYEWKPYFGPFVGVDPMLC